MSRRRARRSNSSRLYFFGSEDYKRAALNSLDIHQPSVVLPHFALAFVQNLVTSGALYPASQDRLDAIPGKHFGDGFVWSHFQTVFDLFDFRMKDKADRINQCYAIILGVLMVLRAILGVDGAFRFWCAIFEAAFPGVKIEFPDSSEPVAVLKMGDELHEPGWGSEFTAYDLWTLKTLESSRNEMKAMRYWQQASLLPEGSYARIASRGFLALAHEVHGSDQLRVDGYGDVYGSLMFDVAKKNPLTLMGDLDTLNHKGAILKGFFGESVADPEKAKAWGDSIQNLADNALSRLPEFPLEGQGLSMLSRLAPIQRYGYVRDSGMPHSGLDLGGSLGDKIVSMYRGVVVDSATGWKKGDGPRGNYVVVRSDLGNGDSFLHEYYHLAHTKLTRGDVVQRGQLIGYMGETGNSTGPHLHLATRWNRGSEGGRSLRRNTIDPERVLLVGAVPAAQENGLAFGTPDKPHLAVPLYILGTVSGSGYSSPVPHVITAQYDAQMAADSGEPERVQVPFEPSNPPFGSTKKEKIKEQIKRAAPDVLAAGLMAALIAAGTPPEVAQAAGKSLEVILTQNPHGSPAEVVASLRPKAPEWGEPVDKLDPLLEQIGQWVAEKL